jgi:threonine/homoserine/homoserine lactone efflux protein
MLSEAIGGVLAPAVGVALSPIPIIGVVLMLSTPRARSNGPAFAAGWVAGLVIVSAVVLLVSGGADDPDSTSSDAVSWTKLVLGVLLVGMALRKWRARPRDGEQPELPKWMAAVDRFTPVRSLALGAGLSGVNPKNLALTVAASASIAQAGLSGGDALLAEAVFVVIGSVTVVGSVVVSLVAGDAAADALNRLKEFMLRHNAGIMFGVLLVLGAVLIGNGIGEVFD